jgi:type I restriction enzyme, S subunit
MTGTSGRQRFQADGFDKYQVPAPDPGLLDRFNETAVPLFEQMTALRDQNRKLSGLRDALLPELLSGRIRVPEAAEAVEEAVS